MKYTILLRGINIGKRTIKSEELKKCFESLGFKDAQTVLATGNVIISSSENLPDLKYKVENSLERYFNFSVKVKVISIEELSKIVDDYPFKLFPEFHRYIIFKDRPLDNEKLNSLKLNPKLESIKLGDKVIYWCVLKGHTLDSDFAKFSAKASKKDFSTTRNLNTLKKIVEKANQKSS